MAGKSKEQNLLIRITGAIDKSLEFSIDKANLSLKSIINRWDKSFSKLDAGFDKAAKLYVGAVSAMGAASLSAAAAAVKMGSEFESAFAGVKKTVDESYIGEYQKLRTDILAMTRDIPSSAKEISEAMEIAGQLGIANDSLEDFTETVINLGVSTNLSAEEAATSLSKFANIVQMENVGEDGVSNWERLVAVVVDLGNHFATTEQDIVDMATNLASTGSLVGLTEAQLMALSTAMSSVGIEAEAGGSAMSKLLKKMQLAVELNTGSLSQYAAVADMTGEQFKETFQRDSVNALSAFIGGLNDAERNGKSAIAILDDMGLTEIRLSNTVLALANSGDLMTNAVETANNAWAEANALSEEAGKRYETLKSKTGILKNGLTELGIVAYDEMREPVSEALSYLTGKVHQFTDSVTESDALRAFVEGGADAAISLFDTMESAMTFVFKHRDGIISVMEAIGAAILAYKTMSAVSHGLKFLSNLRFDPVSLSIMGVTAAIGTVVGAIALYRKHEQKLLSSNLAKHFGNISLSMEEVQKTAEALTSSKAIQNINTALGESERLKEYGEELDSIVQGIEKLNWKKSIGFELSADDVNDYKAYIDRYIEGVQKYAEQAQLTAVMSLSAGFSHSDEETRNQIVEGVQSFYHTANETIKKCGEDLADTFNDAFADGYLDDEEVAKLMEKQRALAEAQQKITAFEADAKVERMKLELSGGRELNYESFTKLMDATAESMEEKIQAAQENYDLNYSILSNQYSGEELDEKIAELNKNYLLQIAEINRNPFDFGFTTFMDTYGDEFYDDQFEERFNKAKDYLKNNNLASAVAVMTEDMDSSTVKAMQKTLDELQPFYDAIKDNFRRLGVEIPEELQAKLDEFDLYSVLLGRIHDSDIVDQFIGEVNGEAPFMAKAAMNAIGGAFDSAVLTSYLQAQKKLKDEFGKGFEVFSNVTFLLNPAFKAYKVGQMTTPQNLGLTAGAMVAGALGTQTIDHNADGGIIRNMELSWLAEKGPEAVIPLDGSQNAVSIWEETGRLLHLDRQKGGSIFSNGESRPVVEYRPTLNFYGEAPNQNDLREALTVSEDEFEALMNRYFKTRRRASFV